MISVLVTFVVFPLMTSRGRPAALPERLLHTPVPGLGPCGSQLIRSTCGPKEADVILPEAGSTAGIGRCPAGARTAGGCEHG